MRSLTALLAAAMLVAACGDSGTSGTDTVSGDTTVTDTTVADTTVADTSTTDTSTTDTTTTDTSTTDTSTGDTAVEDTSTPDDTTVADTSTPDDTTAGDTSTGDTTVPTEWTCDAGYYGDGECDCGCGVVDADCADATIDSCVYNECPDGESPKDDDNSQCFVSCGDSTKNGLDQCDGTDFGDATCATAGFEAGDLACNSDCTVDTSSCTGGLADWTCPATYYADGADCDCGCGVVDPDCDDATAASCGYNNCEDGNFPQDADNSQCYDSCGDSTRNSIEACDGTDFGDSTCVTAGYEAGDLACNDDCSLDTSACTGGLADWTCTPSYYGDGDCDCGCGIVDSDCPDALATSCEYEYCGDGEAVVADDSSQCYSTCGDGVIDEGEDCDGDSLGDAMCSTIGYEAGTLSCADDCSFNVDLCTGGLENWTCDPDYYGDATCDCGCGILDVDCTDALASSCEFNNCEDGQSPVDDDNTQCFDSCGDDVLNGNDQCDGTDFGDATCEDAGFTGGTLSCSDACTIVISACTATCGDAAQNGIEQCDGADLQDVTCEDFGYDSGALACTSTCVFDRSACVTSATCGDNTAAGPEVCDGTDLADGTGADCTDLGYASGDLACLSDCSTFDLAACTGNAPVTGWTCPPNWYDDGDCDCGCGVIDADCADASVNSCDYCGSMGSCNAGDPAGCLGLNPTNNAICNE